MIQLSIWKDFQKAIENLSRAQYVENDAQPEKRADCLHELLSMIFVRSMLLYDCSFHWEWQWSIETQEYWYYFYHERSNIKHEGSNVMNEQPYNSKLLTKIIDKSSCEQSALFYSWASFSTYWARLKFPMAFWKPQGSGIATVDRHDNDIVLTHNRFKHLTIVQQRHSLPIKSFKSV